jgi:hypothetical protein
MNVLSIDFDIIMAPSINLYNNMVPANHWDDLLKSLPNLTTTPADLNIYSRLLRYLLRTIDKTSSIFIGYSHSFIQDYLKNDNDLNITNIDHHHDIFYDIKDKDKKLEECNCADWVKYFHDQGQLKDYTWVHNDNSCDPNFEVDFKYNKIPFKEFEFAESYDKHFICLSPERVPPYYHSLFYTILDCLNEKNNYHLEIIG